MSKFFCLLGTMLCVFCSVSFGATPNQTSKSCEITCYEKTPTCYVTKDKEGCLIISNEKPSCKADGSCTCTLPACEIKSTYSSEPVDSNTKKN